MDLALVRRRDTAKVPDRPLVTVAAVAGSCSLAAAVSFTKPFTLSADLLTGFSLGVIFALQIVFLLRPLTPAAGSWSAVSSRLWLWIVLFAVVVAFELFEYFEHPRSAHPTISSLSDELSAWQAGKAVLFLAWFGIGWLIVIAPTPRRRSVEP
jgi:hypothetical protein